MVYRQDELAENGMSVHDVIEPRDSEIGGSHWERNLPAWSRAARTLLRANTAYGEKSDATIILGLRCIKYKN